MDEEDEDDEDEELRWEPRALSRQEHLAFKASAITDHIFRKAKMRLANRPKWKKLFLGLAKRAEARFDKQREAVFLAASLDDLESLERLKTEVPPTLWDWWSYELGLVDRAVVRGRAQQLRVLPELFGTRYPRVETVAAQRAAMEVRPKAGTSEAILERQRGEKLLEIVSLAFHYRREIDVEALEATLNQVSSGHWRDTMAPAIGINFSQDRGDNAGWRPLHFVAATSSAVGTGVRAAEALLDAKADAQLADASGATPLHAAALNNNVAVVELLVMRGACLEAEDHSGCTPLMKAARLRNAEMVRHLTAWVLPPESSGPLLSAQSELEAQRFSQDASVRLHQEVAKGNKATVKQLVLEGNGSGGDLADVNRPDPQGRCPIHVAAARVSNDMTSLEMVRALVQHRAHVNLPDYCGDTPLHVAVTLQRGPVVQALLALRANPGLPNAKGETPLVLAAKAPAVDRSDFVPYNGALVNDPVEWRTVRRVLEWSGEGDLPIPPPRGMKDLQGFLTTDSPYEAAKIRAEVLAAVGFDDQKIFDRDGHVNRGDRLQLFSACTSPELNDKRLRLLWSSIVNPVLPVERRGNLPPRLSELLQYILVTLGGRSGPILGVLLSSTVGTGGGALPSWPDIAGLLKDEDLDLAGRVEKLYDLGFRTNAPKKHLWVGSGWNPNGFPREPDSAPWGAFKYVDRATAKRLNQQPVGVSYEAFKDSHNPIFEPHRHVGNFGPVIVAHHSDKLQLGNRLRVDEALGLRCYVEKRVRLLAETILCPLISEAIDALAPEAPPDLLARAEKHREMLRYIAGQMNSWGTEDKPVFSRYFSRLWKQVRRAAVAMFYAPIDAELLEIGLEEVQSKLPDQLDLLSEADRRWLERRHSTAAFIAIRRAGGVQGADELAAICCRLAALTRSGYPEAFWDSALQLLLWGRAQKLQQTLEQELKRRLPAAAQLLGPRLRSREEILPHAGDFVERGDLAATTAMATAPSGASSSREPKPAPTDVMRAEVVCKDSEAMRDVYEALCAPPRRGSLKRRSSSRSSLTSHCSISQEEQQPRETRNGRGASFKVVHVKNGFLEAAGTDEERPFPRLAGVVLFVHLKLRTGELVEPVQQLVEVELVLPGTLEGRWLAEYLDLKLPHKQARELWSDAGNKIVDVIKIRDRAGKFQSTSPTFGFGLNSVSPSPSMGHSLSQGRVGGGFMSRMASDQSVGGFAMSQRASDVSEASQGYSFTSSPTYR